jgi:hypothetical protein
LSCSFFVIDLATAKPNAVGASDSAINCLRRRLIEKSGVLIITADYIFRSVTAAAAMVVGASINGRTA